MKRLKRIFRLIIGIGALAVVVAVGLILGALPANMTKLDMNRNKISTPSNTSLDIIRAIDKPVTIYAFEDENINEWLIDLSYRSAAESDYLTVVKGTTQIAANYGLISADNPSINGGSLLIVTEDRHYFLDNADTFSYDYGYDYSTGDYVITNAYYHGDSALASALRYVTRDDMPVACFVQGHGESTDGTFLRDALTDANVVIKTVDLAADGGVPEDCDVLFLYAPQVDISVDEAKMLVDYLEADGKLILMTGLLSGEMPNLYSVAETMGLSANMSVVLENQSNYYLTYSGEAYQQYLKPELTDNAMNAGLREASTQIIMPLSHALILKEDARDSLVITELVSTSESAYAKTNINQLTTYDLEEGDEVGRFTLAAMVQDGDATMVWFSSADWVSTGAESIIGSGNRKLLMTVLDELISLPEAVEQVEVSLAVDVLEISSAARMIYAALIIAVPAGALIAAFAVSARKRRRIYA